MENLKFQVSIGHSIGRFIGLFIGRFANHINILYRKSLPTTIYCD